MMDNRIATATRTIQTGFVGCIVVAITCSFWTIGCGTSRETRPGMSPQHPSGNLTAEDAVTTRSGSVGTAGQQGGYIAFSLKIAEARIRQRGRSWRTRETHVLDLAGINHVDGFVYDSNNQDLILVGRYEEGRVALTLDDLVVALRARFVHNEWPLLSIDPPLDGQKTDMQSVRCRGGIRQTAFGQALFDADYHLKRLGMGLVDVELPGFETMWDRKVRKIRTQAGASKWAVRSRFWFYPNTPHVVVREEVCVMRGLKVGVFTELLDATIDGERVADLKGFRDVEDEAFAKDLNERFESLCLVHGSFNRLRGLQELVGVSKALEEMEERPDLSWWLRDYGLAKVETTNEVGLLRRRYDHQRGWYELSGGVHLTAMALRLRAGDVRALREAVLKTRPTATALSWGFVVGEWAIPLSAAAREKMVTREGLAALFQQAIFLQQQERHGDAVTVYGTILQADPEYGEAYNNRAAAYYGQAHYDEAVSDLTKALALDPNNADAFYNRGSVYSATQDYDLAITDFDKALALNPNHAAAYDNRGTAYFGKGDYARAFADYEKALALIPNCATTYYNRGGVYCATGEYDQAVAEFDKAIALNPNYAAAFCNRGRAYDGKRDYDRAFADFNRAISINPNCSAAYYNRANVLFGKGNYERAFADYDLAIALNPNDANAYYNRGTAYSGKGDYDRAIADYDKALAVNPKYAAAYNNRATAYFGKGDNERALSDCEKALVLDANNVDTLNNRANAYSAKGNYDRAIADYNKVLALRPNHAAACNNRAVAWYEKGEYDKAWADVKRYRNLGGTPHPAFIQDLIRASGRHE